MKNYTTLLKAFAISALLSLPLNSLAQHQLMQPVFRPIPGKALSGKSTLKANRPRRAQSSNDVLVSEHFDNMPGDVEEEPDTTQLLAYAYQNDQGITTNIDAQYTSQPGWTGTSVYAAGHAVALLAPGGAASAALNTPYNDYSGDLTITFRVKGVDPDKTVAMFVVPCIGGIDYPQQAEMTEQYGTVYLPKGGVWKEYTMTFRDYSSNGDGFIQFNCYGKVVLDDIVVKCSNDNFIANPVMDGTSNYTDSTFTINWQPVRNAYDYRVYVYKEVVDDATPETVEADFEDGLPEGYYATSGVTYSDSEGQDETGAAVLHNGDTLLTSAVGPIRNVRFWMKAAQNESGRLSLFVNRNNSWERLGTMYLSGLAEGDTINLNQATYQNMNDAIRGIGFAVSDLPDDVSLYIDNIDYIISEKNHLEIITGTEGYDEEWRYESSDSTSYTVNGIDQNEEYYYKVASHLQFIQSSPLLYHANRLVTPEIKEPTNLDDRGSFTANWGPSPKATRYVVNVYGVTIADVDDEYYILNEDFSKITSDVTSATGTESPDYLDTYDSSLDEYTQLPGWTGTGNTISQGYLGASEPYYYNTYVQTPALDLSNNTSFNLDLKAYGTPEGYLEVTTPEGSFLLQFDENGEINNIFEVNAAGENFTLMFSSPDYSAFMLDEVRVSQELKKGQSFYTFLGSQTVEGATSVDFTGLSDYEYEQYAYDVRAERDFPGEGVETSEPSYKAVFYLDPTGINTIKTQNDVKPVAYYSLDGRQVNHPAHGIYIVKMSDGTAKKAIVK